MNIGNIVQPNTKGQIVIPYKIRKLLGIDKDTLLQLSQVGESVVMRPVRGVVTSRDKHQMLIEVLKKTQGAWRGEPFDPNEDKREDLEFESTKKLKRAW